MTVHHGAVLPTPCQKVPPLGAEDKIKECVLPSHVILKHQACLLDDKLLASVGRGFFTNLLQQRIPFRNQKKNL